ncbi:MAG: hypothetical protein KJO06_12140, partial [Gemmatimonadetes bacterium]|nr:hypothetical protein [Gemmatimonadota bacterium]
MFELSTRAFSNLRRGPLSRPGFVLCLCAAALSFQGCAEDRGAESPVPSDADLEAVEIWAHPDTLGIDVYAPEDFKAASRSVAWAIDGIARGVMRYEP